MESEKQVRRWEEMAPEVLGHIFSDLPLQEILTVVPCVCRAWNKAATGSLSRRRVDLYEWCDWREHALIFRMVKLLIARTSGSLRMLRVSYINDSIFEYIAQNGGSLVRLGVRVSGITNDAVERSAMMLLNLRALDVSYCYKMGARAIEAFGKNCPSLIVFRRAMPLAFDMESTNSEARAIAKWMPNLRTLLMTNANVSDDSVMEILECCKNLEYVNFSNSYTMTLEEKIFREKLPRLKCVSLPRRQRDWDDSYDDVPGQ